MRRHYLSLKIMPSVLVGKNQRLMGAAIMQPSPCKLPKRRVIYSVRLHGKIALRTRHPVEKGRNAEQLH